MQIANLLHQSKTDQFLLKISNLIAEKNYKQALGEFEALHFEDVRQRPALLNAFGVVLRASGQPMRAISMYSHALKSNPDNSGLWSNLGNAFKDVNLLSASISAHEQALKRSSSPSTQLWHNHGIALSIAGQHIEAIESFKKAIELSPEKKNLRWDLARSQLALENYSEGFFNYQYRWDMEDASNRRVFGKEWDGQFIGKEPLFVYAEQGFGDYIQCARFLKKLRQKIKNLEVEVKDELHELMKNSFPNIQFVPYQKNCFERSQGMIVSLLDLPRYMRSEQPLSGTPYLFAPPPPMNLQENVHNILRLQKGLQIGIIWSGSTTFKRNHYRSAPVEWFNTCLNVPGVNLYSLQLGPRAKDLAKLGSHNISESLIHEIKNFADTANIVCKLDLVITTCTSMVHLCGALGVPCWTLLDYSPHWLWGPTSELSPWYKSLRLFRQTAPGDWRSVFDKVSYELIQLHK